MIVNTNITALSAHRNAAIQGVSRKSASARLSSGYRINVAADDAAGLSISERMRNQIRGLNMASKNAGDGISMLQVAEGALQETNEMLKRMRELVVQAANDTLTPDDRLKIAQEFTVLKEEINAIGENTEFNTRKLFRGGEIVKVTEWITTHVPAREAQPAVAPIPVYATAADARPATVVPGHWRQGELIPARPAELMHDPNDSSLIIMTDFQPAYRMPDEWVPETVWPEIKEGDLLYTIPGRPAVEYRAAFDVDQEFTFYNFVEDVVWLQLGANEDQGLKFTIGELSTYALGFEWVHPLDHPIFDFPITVGNGWDPRLRLDGTQGGWDDALVYMDEAVEYVTNMRARLGAISNRVEFSARNLDVAAENASAADSRLRDTDMAKEMMAYVKSGILEQSAIAMLSQASQSAERVLQIIS